MIIIIDIMEIIFWGINNNTRLHIIGYNFYLIVIFLASNYNRIDFYIQGVQIIILVYFIL